MKVKNEAIGKKFRKRLIAFGLAIMMGCSTLAMEGLNKPIEASAEVIDMGNSTYRQTIKGVTYEYCIKGWYRDGDTLTDVAIVNGDKLTGTVIIADQVGNDTIGHYYIGNIGLSSTPNHVGEYDEAFRNNNNIETVIYPDTIRLIGKEAFLGCTNLESVVPQGTEKEKGVFELSDISSIYASSFKDCKKAEKVNLNTSVSMHEYSFDGCSNLQTIEYSLPKDNRSSHIGIYVGVFAKCSKLKEIIFPNIETTSEASITISGRAFSECFSLTKLDFIYPSKIGSNAFEYCNNLEGIVFHESATIDKEAFSNTLQDNGKEKKVVFQGDATVKEAAFSGCDGLSSVEFHGNATIESNAFKGVPINNLSFLQKADLNTSSFDGCSKLEQVTFEDDVIMSDSGEGTDISTPFTNCSSLKQIEFKKGTVDAKLYGLSNLESLIFHKDVSAVKGRLSKLSKLKEIAFWDPNTTIDLEDAGDNGIFNIYGMKGSNGISLAQIWANKNGKIGNYKSVVSNVVVKYQGKVIVGAKAEDIDLDKLEVSAYYYNNPLKAVRLEQAALVDDTFGYTVSLPDIIEEGANPFCITYGNEFYYGNIEGINKAVSKIKVSTKNGEGLTLVEGQTVTKDKLLIVAEYNDGTTEVVTDFSIEAHTIKEGANSIQIFYGGQMGVFEVTGIKKECVNIKAVYDGENPLEGTKLNIRNIQVTLQYNDGTEEDITNYSFPEFNLDQDILVLGENTLVVRAKNMETTVIITTVRKSLESISASYNNTEVVEANEVLMKNITVMAHYNNETYEMIKDYQIDPYVIQTGSNTITIRYEGKATTITVTGIKRSLQAIEAVYAGNSLKEGDVLEKENICLVGIYNDGTKEEIKDKATLVFEPSILHAGENMILITYEGIQTTLKLSVEKEDNLATTTPGGVTASPVPTTTPPEVTPSPEPIQTEKPTITKEPQTPGTLTLKTNVKNIGVNKNKTDTYKIITNKTITFILQPKNVKQVSYQLLAQKKTYKESAWKLVKNNKIDVKTTDKPSVLYLKYVDNNGTSKIIKSNVFLIDKTAPTVKGIVNKKTYKKAVTITFKDTLSGIKSALLNKKSIKNGVRISKKGSYTLVITDKAGNQRKVIFQIKK